MLLLPAGRVRESLARAGAGAGLLPLAACLILEPSALPLTRPRPRPRPSSPSFHHSNPLRSYNFSSEEAIFGYTHTRGDWAASAAFNFRTEAPVASVSRKVGGKDTLGLVYAAKDEAATLTWARKPFKVKSGWGQGGVGGGWRGWGVSKATRLRAQGASCCYLCSAAGIRPSRCLPLPSPAQATLKGTAGRGGLKATTASLTATHEFVL